ncbi:hypothetical protein SCATT_26590 [Streptantibioticus cattleyicolor NRRL 8057 = DSM 46488]|uniref:Tryptophan 2,3-dioxygenase n=1 Tax=Streptantibioticus cattleyicolor (strain ATCC 35852 / DSM 46488 / JCM 4925 / NBRC 14057 / NRRL 8057) TaxID=1003195 RepID=G8WZQ4_STREN|nr:hypothetical protein SCATT_26590 [Streptantibioticus cattleyicolor NRRL 8057 = DSM 46488]
MPVAVPEGTRPAPAGFVLSGRGLQAAAVQRRAGRAALDAAEKAALAGLYQEAVAGGADPEAETLALLTRPFRQDPVVPEYYQYTCAHVYAWFLDHDPADPVGGALLALHTTLADLLATERAGHPEPGRAEHISERVARLTELLARLGEVPAGRAPGATTAALVAAAEADPVIARRSARLAECTRFPRSDRAEEHVFLRSVQASELLFFLIRQVALEACAARDTDPAAAAWYLELGRHCAEVLQGVFHTLLTLSPAGFMTFRDATGAASAVQSLNYHAMEIAVYGYDPRKAPVFASIDHLTAFNSPEVRDFRPLSTTMADAADERLREAWHRLDRRLSKWRGSHYRFARTYLPAGTKASGGTEGAAYVKKFVKKDHCRPGDDPVTARPLLSGFLHR